MTANRRAIDSAIVRRAIYAGDRELRRAAARFGEEIRAFRLRARLSQAQVARAVGAARSVICALEAGDPGVNMRTRFRVASLLGADMRLALYPSAPPMIADPVQARIVERLVAACHSSWHTTVEAPVPGVGRRSSDLRLANEDDIVLFEVETRLRSWEAILRECHDKREAVIASRPNTRVHVALVLPTSRHHRHLVRGHPATVRSAFPATSAEALRALMQGGTWPGDAIVWVRSDGELVGWPERQPVG
ncbi:MAG: helix-turn-helix transcriptional regulator [Candidatus Limnocylindrales bacterium]